MYYYVIILLCLPCIHSYAYSNSFLLLDIQFLMFRKKAYALILAVFSLGLSLFPSLSQVLILWLVFPLQCGGGWSVAEERALVCGRAPSDVGAAVLISAAPHQRWAVWNSTAVLQALEVATMGPHRDLSVVSHSQPFLSLHFY